MKKNTKKTFYCLLILIIFICIACNLSDRDTSGIKELVKEIAPQLEAPTSEGRSPTATRPATEPIQIKEQKFSISATPGELFYQISVDNPDTRYNIVGVYYRVSFTDKNGQVVGANNFGPVWVGVNNEANFYGRMTVPDSTLVTGMRVEQTSDGIPVPTETGIMNFSCAKAYLQEGYDTLVVNGEVSSEFSQDIYSPAVSAVAFDHVDNIIGMGDTLESVLPANGTIPVSVPITIPQNPARVELVFTADSGTTFEVPSGLDLDVEKSNLIMKQNYTYFGAAFILHNPDPNQIAMLSYYQAAVYDGSDNVLGTCSGPIQGVIYPDQKLGFGCQFLIHPSTTPAYVKIIPVVQSAAPPRQDISVNPLVVENIKLEEYQVRATIRNTLDRDLQYPVAWAVAYDSENNLVGQANYSLDTMTANESRDIEIGLYLGDGIPVRAEVFAVPVFATLQ